MPQSALFIGLGVMGFHMAGHLSKSIPTHAFNRTQSKAEDWQTAFEGKIVQDLKSLPQDFDFIITCIGNDQDLEAVYLGSSGLISSCSEPTIFIDHTTASADVARKIAAAAQEAGHTFIDAPVSGGEQGAINGMLTVMCGGDNESFNLAKPIMDSYARAVTLLGDNGAGQLTKMCNQLAVAGVVQGLAEAIHFGEQAGLDCHQVIDVISKGAAQSWQMENRHQTMIEGEYNHGFAVDLMRKDLNICLSEARNIGAKLPLAALVDQFYADIQEMGGNRWDTSSLLERLRPHHKNEN